MPVFYPSPAGLVLVVLSGARPVHRYNNAELDDNQNNIKLHSTV